MSGSLKDFPILVDKKKKRKIFYAIAVWRLLHLMYLVLKHSTKDKKLLEQVVSYDTFERLIGSKQLVCAVLKAEFKYSKSAPRSITDIARMYYELIIKLKERGYSGLLELINRAWDLSLHHRSISHRSLCNRLFGLEGPLGHIESAGRVVCKEMPFHALIKNFRFVILETSYEKAGVLTKTSVYLGSLSTPIRSLRLGLLARLSLKGVDAVHLLGRQREGGLFEVREKMFKYYPTVLRIQRLAYRRVHAVKQLEDKLLNMLSELYVDENTLASIISGDARANLLSMVPSISLAGALCIPVVFRGELMEMFGAGRKTRIRVAEQALDAFTASYSVFEHDVYPGEYVFLALIPFTMPRVLMIVASHPIEVIDRIRPRKREVVALDSIFPRINEVAKVAEEFWV